MSTPFGVVILQRIFAKSEKVPARHCVLCSCSTIAARWMAEVSLQSSRRPSIPTIDPDHRPLSTQSYSVISSGNRISHRPNPFQCYHPASRQHLAFSGISHLLWREKLSVVCEKQKAGQVRYGLTRFADSAFRGIQS